MSGKFRDKETGVEGYLRANRYMEYQIEDEKGVPINGSFKTLSELLEKWEEIEEEPKKYWYIDNDGDIYESLDNYTSVDKSREQMGDRFDTKEEAEKAVERLRAWKRLKDKGFRFFRDGNGRAIFEYSPNYKSLRCIMTAQESKEARADLDLLFGGEE